MDAACILEKYEGLEGERKSGIFFMKVRGKKD